MPGPFERGRPVRVMTYNINAGRYHADGLEAVAKVIAAVSPDIVGLQEVDRLAPRTGGVDQAGWLATRLNMQSVFGVALEHSDGGEYGVALLTRHSVVTHRLVQLPHNASDELRARMPAAIRHHADEARIALAVMIEVAGVHLRTVVTHFGLTADQRLAQAEEILKTTKPSSANAMTVVLGDLNASPDSAAMRTLTQELRDACSPGSAASQATRRPSRFDPPDLPEIARHIDYVLIHPAIEVRDARIIRDESEASDHYPVFADLVLDPDSGS